MAEIIPVSSSKPEDEIISYAANVIRRGELIAFPTDTLYCIAADPFNLSAVGKVFEAKSRAWDRSLPLFVNSIDQVSQLAKDLPSRFYLLAHRYWPGPLAVIVEADSCVPLKVTGNTRRLAVRHPKAVLALRLLEKFGMPLIATSANVSGHPTGKDAHEVNEALGGHISLILDSPVGEQSIATTVDVTVPKWRLIREGAILEEELREFLGD